ncbi:MAG TPA: glycosyltransferase [Bryobacteraceae bacterium]|nr:glycosyltransferase [Bryobacteraceae bacterium]
MFYHSLVSDWNHGNAHFLRGVATELIGQGHDVRIYEPEGGWSRANLLKECGEAPVADFHTRYPHLQSVLYRPENLDLDQALDRADGVLVHEWNEPQWIARLGEHRRSRGARYKLLFHDTHHRSVTDPRFISSQALAHYDGVLAFGESLREKYLENRWSGRVWTWHEAADTRVFHPQPQQNPLADLVWIGNWGDEERTAELNEFVLEPVRALSLRATAHGVRYPRSAKAALASAGIEYRGWLPNFRVPEVFAQHLATVHVPRRPYIEQLPGIPTIRVFEAMACGIPLLCAPWKDREHLFRPGEDYLVARDGAEMQSMMRDLIQDARLRSDLSRRGLETILKRHTCGHRAAELLNIVNS